ncbi:MAG: hotdog domain-containing protein [Thermoanaerobaculia bacterium]|nr:hotdog domain-containing protein [Thermoanaerobaculia bacterium]
MQVKIGDIGEATMIVKPEDSAKALSLEPEDDFPEVFATSRMIALMELAASRLMRSLLQPGQLSVGVRIDVRHSAATPLGAEVRAKATFVEREGEMYRFEIEAFDDGGSIGKGSHVRAIVGTERLVAGARERVKS